MIDFEYIGKVMSDVFDTDYIDIKRDINGELKEVYSNVSSHISYSGVDNPDPTSVDIKPIIQTITIHLPTWVDIRNNDYIIAKRMSSSHTILATYSGRCGNPVVSQGRQKVVMTMSSTSSESPSPIPPINPIKINIKYITGTEAKNTSIEVELGSECTIEAPDTEGYTFSYSKVNGERVDSNRIVIDEVEDIDYEVEFIYIASNIPSSYRFLVNGLYTRDDGSVAMGYHLYKRIPVDSIIEDSGEYTITSDNIELIHDDNGKLLDVTSGAKIVLMPSKVYCVIGDVSYIANNKVKCIATSYTPSLEESNAYVTEWYD